MATKTDPVIKAHGTYHKFVFSATVDVETREVVFTGVTIGGEDAPKKLRIVGKKFANPRQAGRAAFDAVTDFEKLPRLPDARFMTLKTEGGAGLGPSAPRVKAEKKAEKKPAKAKLLPTPSEEPTPINSKRATNDATAKKERSARKPSAVVTKVKAPAAKTTPAKATPKAKVTKAAPKKGAAPAASSKSAKRIAKPASASDSADDLDF